MEVLICNWTPKVIVELVKSVAWPIVVVLVGFGFRTKILDSVRSFLSRNMVSEISASTSGLSAKFVAAKQSSEVLDIATSNASNLPQNMSLEALRQTHEKQRTAFSEEMYQAIMTHLSFLNISNEEQIDLLAKELSLQQSTLRYLDINKLLFRSQFNLLFTMENNEGYISKEDAHRHFQTVKELSKEAFSRWDWIKYIAYPVSNGLLYDNGNGYKLTTMGKSYINYMSQNPQLIDELAKL